MSYGDPRIKSKADAFRPPLVNINKVTGRLLLWCARCGRTDMAYIRGMMSEGVTCCGQDMSESVVPDRIVCVWGEEAIEEVTRGLVARRVAGGNFRVYQNGQEVGRFLDPEEEWPDECFVTRRGVPGVAECRYAIEGLVVPYQEEVLT